MSAAWTGFFTSLTLIAAIGAQNAFVLKVGLNGRHVLPVVLFCALTDALLIAAGVMGFGQAADAFPWLVPVLRYGGAAFLTAYGARAFAAAWKGGQSLTPDNGQPVALLPLMLTLTALTWLNPHVYLDTVVLIGSVAARFGEERFSFAAGAMLASLLFFFALGYSARVLRPMFANPRAWQVLESGVGTLMWTIAWRLLTAA
jgi:L-lysine exporter family protein LysE/ArgO